MERELQQQKQKLQKKSELKINSLKSLNDQLNVKLQEQMQIQYDFSSLQKEYD